MIDYANEEQTEELDLPSVILRKDLREAAANMGPAEVRYLVDLYYQMQEYRKATDNQRRSMDVEPTVVFIWARDSMAKMEADIKAAMDAFTTHDPIGAWAKSITGIGPVLSAGLLAHIDITKAPTVGHIWRYAGLDPTVSWNKGEKRPWNARLKVLCWKIGESFVKVSNNAKDVYGHYYRERKVYEVGHNELGDYAEQAAAMLVNKKIGHDTDAYKAYSMGKLPPGHIDARARRYAVKLFLAHWHETAYKLHYHTDPPLPYPIAHLGHAHKIEPPALLLSA